MYILENMIYRFCSRHSRCLLLLAICFFFVFMFSQYIGLSKEKVHFNDKNVDQYTVENESIDIAQQNGRVKRIPGSGLIRRHFSRNASFQVKASMTLGSKGIPGRETVFECRARMARNDKGFNHYWMGNTTNPCWTREGELKCVPYFFVAGFPKCGTTDLFQRMALHPDFVPPLFKEIHWITRFRFFPLERSENNTLIPTKVRGLNSEFTHYLRVFTPLVTRLQDCDATNDTIRNKESTSYCMSRVTGDFSPSTIWDSDLYLHLPENKGLKFPQYVAADFVFRMNPCTKIVVMMRNPVDRLYSDYLHFYQQKTPEHFHVIVERTIRLYLQCFTVKTIKECVYNPDIENKGGARLRQGIYYVYILDWLERFPREQFMFIRLNEYSQYMKETLAEIFEFLEMDAVSKSQMDIIVSGRPYNSRKDRFEDKDAPSMLHDTKILLEEFYKPFNYKLAEVLEDEKYRTW